jgi:NAD-dependent SIR2 family protein deacetylase
MKQMRCLACNSELTDAESVRKSKVTGEFIDLCNKCYDTITDDADVFDNSTEISLDDLLDLENTNDYPIYIDN